MASRGGGDDSGEAARASARARVLFVVALATLCGVPASPRPSGFLDGRVHLTGYLESRLGAWTQDDPVAPLRIPGITDDPPDNALAVWRNTLDLELDASLVPRTELHAVFRAVYEPRYPV